MRTHGIYSANSLFVAREVESSFPNRFAAPPSSGALDHEEIS